MMKSKEDTVFGKFFLWCATVLDIRPGERMKTWIMFIYFFFIIATIWMLKPVRNSLFLDELGAENLRYVYMGEGVFLIGVVWLFVQFSKKLTRRQLYRGVLFSCIGCLLLFRFLFKAKVPYLSAFFYVWASSYSIIMTTQFFTFANDIFNPGEAKRLFGIILSGGSLGGVAGGILTSRLVGVVGTENLLYVIAAMILACNILVMTCWNHLVPVHEQAHEEKKHKKMPESGSTSGRALLMGSSYLLMILALIMFAKIASTVVDNQFNGMVEITVQGKDARTAFYGTFFSFLNALSFCMQFFITGLVLRHFGIGIALWILPAGLLFGSLGTTIVTALSTSIFLKSFDGSINYSIQQAAREVLYLPVSAETRYKVKPVIDMLGYRIAKSLAGVYIAVMAPVLGLTDIKLGALILLIIPAWAWIAWKLKSGYAGMLRQNLLSRMEPVRFKKRGAEPLSVGQCLYGDAVLARLESFMKDDSAFQRKQAATARLVYEHTNGDLDLTRTKIQEMTGMRPQPQDHAEWLHIIEELENNLIEESAAEKYKHENGEFLKALIRVEGIFFTGAENSSLQQRVLRLFECDGQKQSAERLMDVLRNVYSDQLRTGIIHALVRIHEKNPGINFDRLKINKTMAFECINYGILTGMRIHYEASKHDTSNKSLGVLLQAIQEEVLERVFLLLGLIYPHEKMDVLYSRIQQKDNSAARAHAVELLLQIIDKDTLKILRPVLEDVPLKRWDAKIFSMIDAGGKEEDHWVVLAGLFFVFEFGMQEKIKNLEQVLKNADFSFFKKF